MHKMARKIIHYRRSANAPSIIEEAIAEIKLRKFKSASLMSQRFRGCTEVVSPGPGNSSNRSLEVSTPDPKKRYIFGYHLPKTQVKLSIPIQNLSLS